MSDVVEKLRTFAPVTILLRIKIVLGCSIRTMLETTKAIDVFRTKPILEPCMYITACIGVSFLPSRWETTRYHFPPRRVFICLQWRFFLPFFFFSSSSYYADRVAFTHCFPKLPSVCPFFRWDRAGLLRTFLPSFPLPRERRRRRSRGEKIKTTSRTRL